MRVDVRSMSDTASMAQAALFPLAVRPDPAEGAADVEHGEVFTRPWVVETILDLVGYTDDVDLSARSAVEPACGTGAFLGPMVQRLSTSLKSHGISLIDSFAKGSPPIRAFDLLERNVKSSRERVASLLRADGWDPDESQVVAELTVQHADYLLMDGLTDIDFVVGNPPYIRLEDVPPRRSAAYREACPTMRGRADIYVGFIEAGLRSLRPGGKLGFIVADRWMHNSYGADLRQFVASGHSVDVSLKLHDVDAFASSVSAYPAIITIGKGEQGQAIVADTTREFGAGQASRLVRWSKSADGPLCLDGVKADVLPHWFDGDSLWPSGDPRTIRLMEHLADNFEPLQDARTGTRVGIGVATGADAVYVTKQPNTAEPERMLPLSMAFDTNSGQLAWSGHYLVNPWTDEGLVDLADWPRLRSHFVIHQEALRRRNVARRATQHWYRTIDRVMPGIAERPKLLFPDMRMTSRPVYDPGGLYPHHNLYYVTSERWDLRVLGGLLFSSIAEETIRAYCVKMRGGTMRFQAQYLRMIRVPRPEDIPREVADALAAAFSRRDPAAASEAAEAAYRLDPALLPARAE